MKINQFIARLPALYFSAMEKGGPSYYLQGDPGGGKTSAFDTFPRTMKRLFPNEAYGLGVINGANFTLMTAMGFMIPKEIKGRDGIVRDISKFTDPYWMYIEMPDGSWKHMSEFTGGILLIDEYDKLGQDEKKIVGEAALSKVLGTHRLPSGWVVMFAGNYLHNRSGSGKDLDHMILRRITLHVQNDVECTVDYFKSINVLPEIVQFAEENPQLLFEPQPEDQRPRGCPRTIRQVDIHLQSLMRLFGTDKIPTDPLTQEEIAGGIGKPGCAQLVKTINLGQELHSFEEVVANPTTITLPGKPDAQRLMSYKLASRVTVETASKVLQFMGRMPQEHQAMFVRMAVQRNYQIAFQPDFAAWCGRHSALIAILTKYKVEDK